MYTSVYLFVFIANVIICGLQGNIYFILLSRSCHFKHVTEYIIDVYRLLVYRCVQTFDVHSFTYIINFYWLKTFNHRNGL